MALEQHATLFGGPNHSYVGMSVAAGDFNGDGRDGILAWGGNEAYVVFGWCDQDGDEACDTDPADDDADSFIGGVALPGDLVQVDTLTCAPGVVLKQFTARDVVSTWDVLMVASRATAPPGAFRTPSGSGHHSLCGPSR